MPTKETRRQLLAAVQACDDKKGQDTRILELDPADSGLADFFLITSATNERQAVAIADEIEFRLKQEFGLYASSVEGRRQAEWILLDYVDIVIHVFLEEKRAFYDIERLRKSARNLTASDVEDELRSALVEKTRAVRKQAPASTKTAAKVASGKSLAPSSAVRAVSASPAKASPKGDSKVTAKPAKKAVKKAASKPALKSAKPLKAAAAKPAGVKQAAKTVAKPAPKAAKKSPGAVGLINPGPSNFNQGAKPPILKCEDPDAPGKVGVTAPFAGAKPPILQCEDPDQTIAIAASAAASKPAKKAAKKAPAKAAKKAAKAPLKQAAKKSKK